MLLNYKTFTRREPERDAKKIYLICEGTNREPDYFRNFQGFDSRIQVEILDVGPHGNNSPTGLLRLAEMLLLKSDENPNPKYEVLDEDEVWFVIDTDAWEDKIVELQTACAKYSNWAVAQSNPCFEVWLYFHFYPKPSSEVGFEVAKTWKQMLRNDVPGGFDSKRYYLLIETAIYHAQQALEQCNGRLDPGTTLVFKPGTSIFEITKRKIQRMQQHLSP